MLEWALKYRRQGLSVIPLASSGKNPIIPSWVEYQKRLPTEAEINEWWTKNPNANIGVVTGQISGLVVVDLDGSEGLLQASSMALSSSVISLTGSGKHLWFKSPESPVKNAVRLFPGVDVRGDGGFVVVAPSVHASGRRYRWLNALNVEKLPTFPQSIWETSAETVSQTKKSNEEGWISTALQEMKDGNIDDTLFKICSRLRADNWSSSDALVLLQPHAQRVGATPGHLEEKIENVWNRYEPNEPVSVLLPKPEETANSESIETFLETDEKVEWIADGLIARNSIGFIVGLPETGKTWVMLDLAIEAARGGKWLGCFPVSQNKVLFIDQERFKGETKRRFKAVLSGKDLSPKDVPNLFIKCGTSIKLDLDQSYAAFHKELLRIKPNLVIVDSLATFHTKEENNRKDIQEVLERIKSLRNEFNCTFLFIHHENKLSFQSKEDGKEPSLAEMAGNIALPAAAETVLTVRKRQDGSSLVYHTKSTLAKQRSPFEIRVQDIGSHEKIEVKGYL